VAGRDPLDRDRLTRDQALSVHPRRQPQRVDEGLRRHRPEFCIIRQTGRFRTLLDRHNGTETTKETKVSLVRILPAWFHAIADYAVGATLIVVASVVGGTGAAVATGVVVGAVVLAVSMLTRYPLGVRKVLPFTVHSAGDYLAAALLILSPFALGFRSDNPGLSAFYIVMGIAVLAVSLITNYQYSEKRNWNAPATPATA
jgi:hypothetical protein